MENAGSSDRVNIVAELGKMKGYTPDGQTWSGSRRYYLINDERQYSFSSPVIENLGKADMGDWRHLADFIIWAKRNYPAKRYMLVISGHGSGWASIGKPLKKGGGEIITPETFEYGWMPMDRPASKGVLYDDKSKNHVTAVEMRKVFEAAGPVDIFFMDSCLMQGMSVLYEIRKYAGIIIGSEEVMQAGGVLYKSSFKKILARPDMSLEEAAEVMVFPIPGCTFMGHPVFTLSAVRTSGLEHLAGMLGEIAVELMASGIGDYRTARDKSYQLDEDSTSFRDLGSFLNHLSELGSGASIREKAAAARDFLKNSVVIYNHAIYDDKQNGLSIYLPSRKFVQSFKNLSFAEDTYWDELIKAGLK